jgi:hypothetical protein
MILQPDQGWVIPGLACDPAPRATLSTIQRSARHQDRSHLRDDGVDPAHGCQQSG